MVERQAVNLDDAGSNPAKSVSQQNDVDLFFYKYRHCKDVDCASLLLRQLGLTHASVVL